MGKQYDRLLDRSEGKRKQDITSFDDYLWRMKVALNRVRCLGSYIWVPSEALKKIVDEVLKKTKKLSSDLEKWRNCNLTDGKKTIQLGTLPETVDQLEDMADDIEYTRSKQRQHKFSMKPNQLPYITEKLRLAFKIEKTKELLQKLLGIIEDFQKEYNSESCSAIRTESGTESTLQEQDTCVLSSEDRKGHKPIGISEVKDTDYTSSPISKGQTSNEITQENDSYNKNSKDNDGAHIVSGSEDLLKSLFIKGGDLVIAYGLAPGTEKAIMPVDDIFHDERVRQEFELLLSVRASDRTMSTVSPQSTPEESVILNLMNSSIVHVEGEEGCRCYSNKKGKEGQLPGIEGSSNMSQGVEVNKAQELIEEFSKGRKFLLVLDDVSKDQLPQLHCLLSALSSGNNESRILISSQSSEVLESLRGIKISKKRNIGDSIFWYFFRSLAFRDENSSTSQKEKEKEKDENPENLENMGKEISRHLIKFPLAAKMVAKMLNTTRDHQFWDAISRKVRSVVESVDCEHCQLLSLLKICYDELPAPLRLCFQYCSLFPNNWTFTSESLVQLWMSQGFLVKDPDKERTLEDVGQRNFHDLHSSSFFEKITDDDQTSFYSLHKVLHSFAQVAAGEEFMRIESDIRPEKSVHVRHLSVESVHLSALYNVDAIFRLRTLIIFGPINSEASEILEKILPRLRKTRTLDLTGCGMKTFPKLTDDLRKHLRFLSIYDTGIQKLPDDFCEFLHLQFLNILGSRLKKLPSKTTRLCNLRHISGPTFLTSEMRHIGKLKSLQELEDFPVSKTHRMQDLGGIKDLRGSITISNLEKVKCTAAAKARLCDKGNLNSLKLEWSSEMMQGSSICGFNTLPIKSRLSAKVLELLQPHPALNVLEINWYIGGKCPSWFTADVLRNIAVIRLRNCVNWNKLPRLGDLPLLKTLKLENCDKFASFGYQYFKVLNELILDGMPELHDWKDCHGSFPLLKLLTIQNCPKLKTIPLSESPESLTRLIVRNCSDLLSVGGTYDDGVYLPSSLLYVQITGCNKIERIGLRSPASLQELLIKNCSKLMDLEPNNVKADFPSLRRVHVDKISLLKPHFRGLICLQELTIEDEDRSSLDYLPESLLSVIKKLRLINCKKLEALPDMKQFSALKSLQLKQCHKISSLPFLPYSMDVLRIDDCSLLENQCRVDGPAWSMISHVPYIYV